MTSKPTYDELVQKINVLESEALKRERPEKLQQILQQLMLSLKGKKGLRENLEAILTTIFQLGAFDSGGVYLVDEKTGGLNFVAGLGLPPWFEKKVAAYEPDDSRTHLIMAGEPLYLTAHQFPEPIAQELEEANILSAATIPLFFREKVIGCFNLASHTCKVITQENKRLVEAISETYIGLLISWIMTEESLRENEEKFSKAFHSNASLMALSFLEDGRFIDINDEFLRVLGYDRKDLIGNTSAEMNLFSDINDREAIKQAVQDKGYARNIEIMTRTKTGAIRYGLFSGEIIKLQGQSCWLTVLHDITERKLMEKALQESEERYRAIAEDMPVLICRFLPGGEITYVNEAYAKHFGKTAEKIIGQTLLSLIPETDGNTLMANISALTVNSPTQTHEHQVTTPAGDLRWQRWIIRALFDDQGRTFAYQSIGEDITKHKQLEEQLRQAHKMESIGTLAGGIAHDFNNILGIIIGNTELAMNDVPEWNPARHNLEEAHTACLRARDMVRQILTFSRLKPDEEKKPVHLISIIKDSLKLIRSSLPTTIKIQETFSCPTDTILANPTQINQILLNLCTNAAHALQEKGGTMEIALKNIDLDEKEATRYQDLAPGKYLALRVKDTGCGIRPNLIERIFDPYFSTKEIGEGAGMGLAVVHGIVKNHQGAIHVSSKQGEETTFEVILPLIEDAIEPKTMAEEAPPTGKERILFVDDEKALSKSGQQILQYLGYDVTMRTSSLEALEAFKAQPDKFDLVITDMTMPNMTGTALSQEILQVRPDLPIILCTGFNEMITEEKAKHLGIKKFVIKPLAMRELAKIIRQVLDQEKEKSGSTHGRILLAEDDDQMRATIRRMLEKAGYEVVEAPDGKIATKLYRERPTDLIITDLVMPEKEGIELILELRRDFPEVKIIAISGGGRLGPNEYLPIAKDLGASYTIEKPFDQETILSAVQDILHQ